MFDNICSLPVTSEVFCQATHPSEPLFSVGLSAGHVQTFRLPPILENPVQNGSSINKSQAINGNSRKRRNSENGFDVVDTVWRTRRHKGSCRAVAFSSDGGSLFSAGTDGIIKAASTETGRVYAKIAVPNDGLSQPEKTSVLSMLSKQNMLIGTDTGRVHVFDLRQPTATPSAAPSSTLRPHATPEDPKYAEAISSLSLLPPNASSTSGTSRMWFTTSGSSVAVTDLRKGVVSVSEDQGDILVSSAYTSISAGGSTKKDVDKVVVGETSGVLSIWERGMWGDQSGRIVVQKDNGGISDEASIDALASVPENVKIDGRRAGRGVVVAGLGNGSVKFVRLRGRGGDVVGAVGHDELNFEGVTALSFDVAGRMISGGGLVVKVWHEKSLQESENLMADQEQDSDDDDAEEAEEESDSDSDEAPKPVKKRKKDKLANNKHGAHGILAFEGMD